MEQFELEESDEGEAAPTDTTPTAEPVAVVDLSTSDRLEECGFGGGASLFASVLLNGIGLILWISPCGNDSDCRLKNKWCFLSGPILAVGCFWLSTCSWDAGMDDASLSDDAS